MAFSGSRSRCSRNGSPYSDDSERVLIIGDEDETLPLRMIFGTLYINSRSTTTFINSQF